MFGGKWGFAAAVCLAAATPAAAGEELAFGPVAEWIEVPATAPAPGEENGLPARLVAMDSQVRFEGSQQSAYSRLAIQFQTPEGLASGNLSFDWRPDTQDIVVHHVLIRRGDETIDVLASGQTFTILRRESSLEQAMLDGTLTASMFPEDLQVGDILEFASTVTTRDPVLAGHHEISVGPLNFPVDRFDLRLQWPTESGLTLSKTEDLPEWRRTQKDGFQTAALSIENVEPMPLPRLAPLRYSLVRFIQASNYSSWADIAAFHMPLYAKAARIPAQGPLRSEVERIRESSADPVARAEATLALVQGRVRYVALAMGAGGLVPANAEETWARRFGDCKAKTALLLAILGELGIEAHGVAVHTEIGDAVAGLLPAIGAFNHILVRARIDGKDYWLDGTRTGDTSLARLQVPDFGWGLPIVDGAELVRIVPLPLEQPQSDITIHMDASKGVKEPVPTKVELTYRGDTATGTNQALANFVGEARDRALREFWRRRFNFIEPDKVGLAYDATAAELRLSLEGQATMDWDDGWYQTNGTGLGYRADFTREAGPGQDAPYFVGPSFYTRTQQTIVLPPGFSGPPGKDLNVDETIAGVEYKRRTHFADNTLVIEASERSVAREFAAADAPVFEKRLRELANNAVYLRIPSRYRLTEADLAVIVADEPESAQGFIEQGVTLIGAGRYDDAIAKLERATALEPESAWAWANLGVALAHLNQSGEAETALDRAQQLDPEVWVTYNGRGLVAERRLDFPAAIAAFSKVIDAQPDNFFAWGRRAMAHAAINDHDRALSDAARTLELSPGYLDMYSLRARALNNTGKRSAARSEVEAMLSANPENPYATSIAGQLYRMLGDDETARSLAEAAVETAPTAIAYFQRSEMREQSDAAGKLSDLDAAIALDPAFVPALAARATLRAQTGDVDGALADATNAIALSPAPMNLYVLKADLARRKDRPDEAMAAAADLMRWHGDSGSALIAAGRIYASLGSYSQAIDAADKAIALSPEPFLYIDRSRLRDPADFDARLADIEEALRRSPTFRGATIAKAALLAERGDHASAVRAYGQALAHQPNDAPVMVQRGISLHRLGREREAERDFAQARRNARDAATLNNICYVKAVASVALERALEECDESLRLLPDYPPTLDSRGTVLLQMGRLEEAIQTFDRVLEKQPDLVPSRYLRAVALFRKGDLEAAKVDEGLARNASPQEVQQLERDGFSMAPDGAGD